MKPFLTPTYAMMLAALLGGAAGCSVPDRSYGLPQDGGPDGPSGPAPAMLVLSDPTGGVSFGDVVIGRTSGINSVAVQNAGDLDSGPLTISIDAARGFAIVDDHCTGLTLPGHHTCSLGVSFTPAGPGAATALVRASATPGDTAAKTLSGTGLTPGKVDIVEIGFDFNRQDIAARPSKTSFRVQNFGAVQVPTPTVAVNGNASFVVDATTCTAPLDPGKMCTVTVAFAPTAVGQKAASLTVTAGNDADAATLTGTGTVHVKVSLTGRAAGRVTSFQTGIDCPTSGCEYDFAAPTNLDATPTRFLGWSGACTGTGSCGLDATGSPQVVTATFDALVTTLAGNLSGDGTGAAASFQLPFAIAFDPAGILYVLDNGGVEAKLRKIVIATQTVTTLALPINLYPIAIATDGPHLFLATSSSIHMMDLASGTATTLAGAEGVPGASDGVGTAARFNGPGGLASDGTNLYVADAGNATIRKVVLATGVVTTIAGSAGSVGAADDTGAAARFVSPFGLALAGANLYVTDANTIRKVVLASGVVTTLAGLAGVSGSSDGTGTAASFNSPAGLWSDGSNLYIADQQNATIRKLALASNAVTTIAGMAGATGATDGTGGVARFDGPHGLASDGTALYIADVQSHAIRRLVLATSSVTTLAGAVSRDGVGAAAHFNQPQRIASDGTHLFVADSGNSTIRQITIATGAVTTLAGTPGSAGASDGIGSAARFDSPTGVATDGANVYVADTRNHTIRKIVIATGAVSTLAGLAHAAGNADGTGAAARLVLPDGITTDGVNLFVSSGCTIRRIVIATAEVTTLAGGTCGTGDGTGSTAHFVIPHGLTADGGWIYVADEQYGGTGALRRVEVATGTVTTIATPPGRLQFPADVTSDGINLYIANSNASSIDQLAIGSGEFTTLAGNGYTGGLDGPGSIARLFFPTGITHVGATLYVADTQNNAIRVIR